MNRAGADSYYHYDGLGSTRQLTNSAGAVTVSYTYDGFGNLIASTGTSDNTYGFTGQQQFEEADNLVFLRARYYEPSIGKFISRDPLGYADSMNLYTYVRNNPVNYTDPTGKIASCPAKEPEGNPAFCKSTPFDEWLHRPLRCYREVVPIGSIGSCGLWPCGNQCCYSDAGEFCEQSPDCVARAIGGGGGKCEYDWCRTVAHGIMDVIFGCGNKLPKPPAPPVGRTCPK